MLRVCHTNSRWNISASPRRCRKSIGRDHQIPRKCKDRFDAAHAGEIIDYAISEHVEFASVHSGDATLVFGLKITSKPDAASKRSVAKSPKS